MNLRERLSVPVGRIDQGLRPFPTLCSDLSAFARMPDGTRKSLSALVARGECS